MWLIDFNPFGEVTDSLLFTWEELTSGTSLSLQVLFARNTFIDAIVC